MKCTAGIPVLLLGAILLLALHAAATTNAEPSRTERSSEVLFGAYYTRVDSGEPFEKYSRTGPHADIVVSNVGAARGRLVFWRGSSYLPYWEVDGQQWFLKELTERSGNGPPQRPDAVNTYSRVTIVKNTPEKVVVHWRYLPRFEGTNPHFNKTNLPYHGNQAAGPVEHLVTTTSFVDEYFTVRPDGSVTRTFRRGTDRYEDWSDPTNQLTCELTLVRDGIRVERVTEPHRSRSSERRNGAPRCDAAVVDPVRWWTFDEGLGDTVREHVTGASAEIEGHRSYWKRGVSGTCLAFDGYTSAIRIPAERAPELRDAVTLEGWIALGAYPWNWTPVVQQGHEQRYALSIGPHGHVRISVVLDGRLVEVLSQGVLERKEWAHVAGSYDPAVGMVRVYIDGRLEGEQQAPVGASLGKSGEPLQIGQGIPMMQSDPVRRNTFMAQFSFDGLIDEVRIYNRALTPQQVSASHKAFQLSDAARTKPDLDPRVLPAGLKTGTFGASYTHLKFYDTWDGLFRFGACPDVVVEFDRHPTSFVFWRGTCYIPMLVNESGQWYSNEFNETWNRSGGRGCQEPMSDKESFSNHAKILENTPARCVVLWRYPLVDVLHVIANYNQETGWGDWSDWTYTIYPDGVAAKELRCWTDGSSRHEWQEGMVITGPDQHPEQVLETDPALRLLTLDGEVRDYSWKNGPPRGVDYRDVKIHVVNYKGQYDPFTIADIDGGDVYSGEVTDYSVFPSWNHWPVAQVPSDGRYAKHPDRTAHSSLTHVRAPLQQGDDPDRPYRRMFMLEGLSTKTPEELIGLAKSWLHAPGIEARSGCKCFGYDQAKREYPLVATNETMTVSINASAERPLVNVCFGVRNWGARGAAEVLVNGRKPSEIRQGTFVDTDGTDTMIIWIEIKSSEPVEFTIGGAKPKSDYVATPYLDRLTISSSLDFVSAGA